MAIFQKITTTTQKVGNSIIGGTMSPEEEREWIRIEQQQDGKSTT